MELLRTKIVDLQERLVECKSWRKYWYMRFEQLSHQLKEHGIEPESAPPDLFDECAERARGGGCDEGCDETVRTCEQNAGKTASH